MVRIKSSELISTVVSILFTLSAFITGVLLQYLCRPALALSSFLCNFSMLLGDFLLMYIELQQYVKTGLTDAC